MSEAGRACCCSRRPASAALGRALRRAARAPRQARLRGRRSTKRRPRGCSASPATTRPGSPRSTASPRRGRASRWPRRGGYGMTRLLDRDRLEADRAGASTRGTRWVGMSDMTSLQLGLLAHGGGVTWAGPLACDDFGRSAAEGGVDEVTEGCFVEAMSGALEAVGFRTDAGFDGLACARHAVGRQPDDRQRAARRRRTGRASRAASCSSRTSTSIRIGSSAICCSFIRPAFSTRRRRSCWVP